MNSKRLRRPSPAAIVLAVLALVLAIGGTAFAVSKVAPKNSVTGKSVKNASLKGKDLKNNSVKGVDIDESTLELPKAAAVDAFSGAAAGGDLTGKYPNPVVKAASITLAKLADDSVTSSKIAKDTIADIDIASNAVGTTELKTSSVGSSIVINGSLSGVDVLDGSIASPDIKNDSITSDDTNLGFSSIEQTGASDSANQKVLQVFCPDGFVAIGGGGRIAGANANSVSIDWTAPSGDQKSWIVQAHEHTAINGSWAIETTANCLKL